MPNPADKPSFSPARKWTIAFNVLLATLLVFASAVMVNYLSGRYFQRLQLSTRTSMELSPRSINLVRSITNDVLVTLYFDRDDGLYSDVAQLLKEYHAKNSKITVATVDYYRNPGAALGLKTKFNLGSSTNENFIIFESAGRVKVVPAKELVQTTLEAVPNSTEREYRRKPEYFYGEMRFTEALLALTMDNPLKACFLTGHGEQSIHDTGDFGLTTFTNILKQNYVMSEGLSLLGTNTVPDDCNLLIVAGPKNRMLDVELDQIDRYLAKGGRLFALFNANSRNHETGLEGILKKYGVTVATNLVLDPAQLDRNSNQNIGVSAFTLHPAVNPVLGSGLYMFLPRPVSQVASTNLPAELKAEEIAQTSDKAYLFSEQDHNPRQRRLSVMVAVERAPSATALQAPGPSRMLVSGDSFLLANQLIELLGNRDFASSSINWLMDRGVLLGGVGPRPVTEYRLMVSQTQMQTLQWTLLGAIPGGILLLGGLVWVSRRK